MVGIFCCMIEYITDETRTERDQRWCFDAYLWMHTKFIDHVHMVAVVALWRVWGSRYVVRWVGYLGECEELFAQGWAHMVTE